MKLPISRPIAYLAGAAVLVALLVIARPVLNPTTVQVQQSSNQSVATAGQGPAVPVVDLNLDRLRTLGGELRDTDRDPFRFRPKPPPPTARIQAPPTVVAPPVPQGPP